MSGIKEIKTKTSINRINQMELWFFEEVNKIKQ